MKIKINVHSFIDVITNSSTELFITVKADTEEMVEDIIQEVMNEMGCNAVYLSVYTNEDLDGNERKGVFDIFYNYETHHEPCDMLKMKIKDKLEEVFL